MKLLLSLAVAASLCATAFSAAKVGTNMGGWLVLEPWITPSLFYRFLGKTETDVGMDAWTLCEALGAVEGNKLMRAHWDSWVTEEHIKGLADRGVELVRLPVGDWTLRQYGPYTGCMDGAEDYIQWFLDTAHKYDLDVLLDVHAVKDSQNGFDNSGQSRNLVWTDPHNFQHWDILTSDWMGAWNGTAYESINQANMAFALQTVEQLLDRWGAHPALYALEPVNEPWWNSDMPALKTFYRQVRALMQRKAPLVTFVFHDAFQLSPSMWNDLFEDTDK
ncbi:glycoside hydrolase superfamily, partial [Ochromonadaceae sp. CCMP2298]